VNLSRRSFLIGSGSIALVASRPEISNIESPLKRILLIQYGQSNMANFSLVGDKNCPPPLPDTFFLQGSAIGPVPPANGQRYLQNSITRASGRPTLALNGSAGGTPLAGLMDGGRIYSALIDKVRAVLEPTDECFIIFDQGEGDADAVPHPDLNRYVRALSMLHQQIASSINRTKASCPFVLCGKGVAGAGGGNIGGGTTPASWQTIKNAQWDSQFINPFMYYSHSEIDFSLADSYHYDAASQGKSGARFSQAVNKLLGLASDFAVWTISDGQTVDPIRTKINLVHSLGTDFTPISEGNGWEVSGDNGATWSPAASARLSSTQLQLLHPEISVTSARLVRYCYGNLPPNASIRPGHQTYPPTDLTIDNSRLSVPLVPTRWDIRPLPIIRLPVPTYRYGVALNYNDGAVQTYSGMPLGPPSKGQRFLVVGLLGPETSYATKAAVTITPTDYRGNEVGRRVATSRILAQVGNVRLMQAILGADANAATLCNVSVAYNKNPFAGTLFHLWTLPLDDLSAAMPVSSNFASTSGVGLVSVSTTLNVSANGFVVQIGSYRAATNNGYSNPVSIIGSEAHVSRFEQGSGIPGYVADAANCAANPLTSITATFSGKNASGADISILKNTLSLAAASWR
jgi:hypothetical protein